MERSYRTMLAVALAALVAGGCVERELQIESDPPGALVIINDEEIGRTPLTVPFEWYGDYDVMLRMDGYQTLKTHANLTPPWYDIPPWDFVSQAMVPWTYHHRVAKSYTLEPLVLPDNAALLDRAEQMRQLNLEPVEP